MSEIKTIPLPKKFEIFSDILLPLYKDNAWDTMNTQYISRQAVIWYCQENWATFIRQEIMPTITFDVFYSKVNFIPPKCTTYLILNSTLEIPNYEGCTIDQRFSFPCFRSFLLLLRLVITIGIKYLLTQKTLRCCRKGNSFLPQSLFPAAEAEVLNCSIRAGSLIAILLSLSTSSP